MLEGNKLKTIACSACGGDLEVKNQRTKFVTCQYCGTTSDISGVATDIKKGDPNRFKPKSFLKIGMIGNFDGIAYQIIGRTCWYNDYHEWDSEDGKYYKEKWEFDEWTLLSDEGTYRTIIEDKEGYKVAETQIPVFPNIPSANNNKMTHFQTGKNVLIQEYGISYIRYFEGESTYLIQIDDYSRFAQYSSGAAHIAEWRYSDLKEIKEVEFFQETRIGKNKLLEAFSGDPAVMEVAAEARQEKNASKLKGTILLAFGIINLIVGIYFLNANGTTETILFRQVTLTQNIWSQLDEANLVSEGEFDVKLVIPKDIPGISLYSSCSFPADGVELKSTIQLFNANGDTLAQIDDLFYSFLSGTDSTAYKNDEIHSFSTVGLEEQLTVKMRLEIPKKYNTLSEGMTVDYLFQSEGIQYGSGASFSFMFGLILIIVGLIQRRK